MPGAEITANENLFDIHRAFGRPTFGNKSKLGRALSIGGPDAGQTGFGGPRLAGSIRPKFRERMPLGRFDEIPTRLNTTANERARTRRGRGRF
jgi:hypothetical protein